MNVLLHSKNLEHIFVSNIPLLGELFFLFSFSPITEVAIFLLQFLPQLSALNTSEIRSSHFYLLLSLYKSS